MTTNARKIQTPLFESFAALLQSFDSFKTNLYLREAVADALAIVLLNATEKAEKTLKLYLLSLKHNPGGKKLSAADVTASFHAVTEAWKTIPTPLRFDYVTTHPANSYEESVVKLLQSEPALREARDSLNLSLADMIEDIFN